jgi:acetyl esterase/lipase
MLTAIESRRLNRGLFGHSLSTIDTRFMQYALICSFASFMGLIIASVSVTSALASAGGEHTLGPLQRERDSTPDAAVNFAFTSADPTPVQPPAKGGPTYTRIEDVVYGHRDGLATTMDVFTPNAKPNGAGVIIFVSAEYRSGRDLLYAEYKTGREALLKFHPTTSVPFLDRGYVVFQVMHSSQPRYTVKEIVEDAHRAVRFIKYNAKKFGVDPAKIGVAGASSGGHLSLMMGCAGSTLDPKAKDPVDRESSHAAAVACYFPPSDFPALAKAAVKKEIPALFDFRELDPKTGLLERVPAKRQMEIARDLSPINHVTKGAAPTLIIHGDEDDVVPITQSQAMIEKLKKCGVESKLLEMKGNKHFDFWVVFELPKLADWFDIHLLGKKLPEPAVPQQPPVSVATPKTISDCSRPHENETRYAPSNWGNSCVALGNWSNVERNRIIFAWKLRQKY